MLHNFEANHNKDYSVVKTFKAALNSVAFFLFAYLSKVLALSRTIHDIYKPFDHVVNKKTVQNERLCISNRIFPVIRAGFEPTTHSLEGCCSIQLSYRTDRFYFDGAKIEN